MMFPGNDDSRSSRPRLRFGLAGAVAVFLVGGLLGGAIAPNAVGAGLMTMRAHPTILDPGQPVMLSGEIDARQAGETVEIEAKDCGAQFFRGRYGVETTADGSWSTQLYLHISTTLRAVWKGNASASVAIWQRAGVYLGRGRKGRLWVQAWGANAPVFWRRKIQIQQRKAGAWKTVKNVLHTMDGNLDRTYFKLSVRKGTLIRAVIPKSSAKPCFLAGTSKTLRT